MSTRKYSVIVIFMKIGAGCKWIDILHCPHFCLFWVKFGMRDLNVMPVSMYKFHENQCREGHTFHMDIMKSHLHMYCKNIWYLESTLSCNTHCCSLVTFFTAVVILLLNIYHFFTLVWNTLNSSLSILLQHCQSMNVCCLFVTVTLFLLFSD